MLNDQLYIRLRRLFHDKVGVVNGGAPMRFSAPVIVNGRKRSQRSSSGEEYKVDCPFCRDTRQRLLISHGYGRFDPVTGRPMAHLANCFNEGCTAGDTPTAEANRERLWDMIGIMKGLIGAGPVSWRPGQAPAQQLIERPLPGSCCPLIDLPPTDSSRVYLAERRFGADTMREFNLQLCTYGGDTPAAMGRIIAPITQHGIQVGWQARYVGQPPDKFTPKYYSCPGMPKRLILYNLDRVIRSPFVVVVEGCTDAWRIPNCAVALLGKSMSLEQMGLLQQLRRQIVLCLDADAYNNSAQKIHEMIAADQHPVRVRLPPGRDPADLDTGVLLSTIRSQAQEAGVELGGT